MVSGTGNTTMGCYPSSNTVTVGNNFNVTFWLNADENISAWLVSELSFNKSILGMVNANSVTLDPYWRTGFYDNGTIHNNNGNITDVQAFIMVDSTTNTTIFTVNFLALECGLCYINLTEAEAYNPENVLSEYFNTSVMIHPQKPTGFSATVVYQNRIDLNWTKQTGMDKTYIRYKTDSYPTSITDGIELYNDSGVSTSHTGLSDGVTIYYSAWGWNETYGLFSIDYAMTNGESTMDSVLVKIETTQFIIFILLILFCMFIWISYRIPDLAGEKKSLHYIPFSGGLFVIFGALDFISLAIILNDNYSIGIIGGFLTVIGIILLLYGVLKAFYYE
jgi:hypothetical protein